MRTGALALLFSLFLFSCDGDGAGPGPAPVGKTAITSPGTGEANRESLWPLRVGSQFRFAAATLFIGRDFDLGGRRTFILQSAVRTRGVLPEALGAVPDEFGETETWLGETEQGVVLYATSAKHLLPHALLIVPATVRDGMKWTISGGDKVIAEGEVDGGRQEETIFGRRRTWHIVITRKELDGRALEATFAEGRGLISIAALGVADEATHQVQAAIVPLVATAAPPALALTPMQPLFGGKPLTPTVERPSAGLREGCAGVELELTRLVQGATTLTRSYGAGGSYISATEGSSGAFDVRIGGVSARCHDDLPIPQWGVDAFVWGARIEGGSASPTTPPTLGYEAPTPQDARTSVWTIARTKLVFHPVDQSGARQQGIFFRPPPAIGIGGPSFEGNFAHSGSGTFIDADGAPVSIAPTNGIALISTEFPDRPGTWWYWPQQPTGEFAPRRELDPLPLDNTPLVIADAEFIAHGGSTNYLVDAFGRIASGRIEDLPDEPRQRTALSGLRDGPLNADPLTTILRHGNTRETFLAQHHTGIWKLEHSDRGLLRRLLARPAIPAGQRIIGAFQAGDQVIVATDAGEMFVSSGIRVRAIATGKVFFWQLPVVPGAEAEPFPPHLELHHTAVDHDLRIEWSPHGEAPPSTGWTLADANVRALPVAIARSVGDEPGIAIPRRALLLNRRSFAPATPELSVPPGLSGPTPPPLPPLYQGQGELGAYRAEGEVPGLGRVVFAGRAPAEELPAGPGYRDPPVLQTPPDENGARTPEPVVRDARTRARWTMGALTTPSGACSAGACMAVSMFVDRAATSSAHPGAFLPETRTWLVPSVGDTRLSIRVAPPTGGVVVEGDLTGTLHHVAANGTITALRYPPRTPTSSWVGGPSIDPAVPGALALCETARNETTRVVSVTCTTSDGRARTSETLIEPTLNEGAGRVAYDAELWPGEDADRSVYVARSAVAYWNCSSQGPMGPCVLGASLPEFRSHRLDLAAMRFRPQSDSVNYVRADDGELYAVTQLFDAMATAWRLFHVTPRGSVLLAGGVNPFRTGDTQVSPVRTVDMKPVPVAVDDVFVKVRLADGWLRIPRDDANAMTSTCDFNAVYSSAGCACAAGFVGDGTTCAPALGSLANPARSCAEWYAMGAPSLGQHNPVLDDDGPGPRLPYVNLCARVNERVLEWPYFVSAAQLNVKLHRDTWAPLECVAQPPGPDSPDWYAYAYASVGTMTSVLPGEFELTFTLSHNESRAGIDLDTEDGFASSTLEYTGYAPSCAGSTAPRTNRIAVVADDRYPASMHAFRVIEGGPAGDVESDLPADFQAAALGGAPLKLTRDAAGSVTLSAGAASYAFARPHPGTLRIATEGRRRMTSRFLPETNVLKISLAATR